MAVPLPEPYTYHPTEFVDVRIGNQLRYWPTPVDTRTGNMVTEERAGQLLRDLLRAHPEAEADLLSELPRNLGIRDEGERKETDLQIIAEQKEGNRLSIKLVTPGFAAVPGFRTTQRFTKVLVANKELVPIVGGTPIVADDIQSVDNGTFLLELFRSLTPADWQVVKALGMAQGVFCDCTEKDDEGNAVPETFTIVELYKLSTGPTAPPDTTGPTPTPKPTADPIVRVDYNTCEGVGGWAANPNNTAVPQDVDLYVNGQFEVTLTPLVIRARDVAPYLRDLGYTASDSSLFQWNYVYPAKYRQGAAISIQVFASGTRIEAGYNAPQTTGVCGVSPTNPNPPAATIVQQRIDGTPSLTAGQTKRYWTTDRYSDDTEKRRTTDATYSIEGGTPFGVTLTPVGAEVDITYAGSDTGRSITLVGTYPGGGRAVLSIQLVGNVCQRPANLAYRPQLVFNAVLASGGNARLYTSLEDANTTIGKHFDGTAPLNLNGGMFPAEMANYNVGTDVYYRWSPEYTSCERVSDGIYPVLSADGSNGQKIAILVVNGKIAAVLASTYVTPTKPTPGTPGIPNSSLLGIAYGYTGVNDEYSGDLLVFARNGTQPPSSGGIDGNTAPSIGFSNGNQTVGDNSPMSSIDNYLSQLDKVPRWESLLRAAKQAGYIYVGRGSGIDFPGEIIRYRVRGNRTESGYVDYSFTTPAYNVTVPLTQLYPAPQSN